jgi:O-antigen/teichoic acid export membrane protein
MPALLPLLFGQEFIPAIPNAMVLTATAALAFSTIGSSLVYAKERSGFIALSGLVGAILSVVAGFVIISNYGVWGAVWSRMFVQSFMVALGMWFIAQRLHFSYPYKSLWNTFVAASLCAFSAWLTIQMMPNHYFALGLAIPLGVAVYIIGVKFFRILGQEEVCQLRRFANRLPAIAQKLLHLTLDAVSCTK